MRYALVFEFLAAVTEAHAELEAAIGHDIDGGRVFGDAHGVVQGQQNQEGADADARSPGGNAGGYRQQRWRIAIVDE
jgi:hypothetical protein